MELDAEQRALVALGERLVALGYTFVTPTPATHRLVNARAANAEARSLTDVFGWTRPFAPGVLPADVKALCDAAGVLAPAGTSPAGPLLRSTIRWSSCADRLFLHSAFPTDAKDAVFFGPDSYRFVAFLQRSVWKARRLVDVGCGTGVGGLALAHRVDALVLGDINPAALRAAAVNATLGGHGTADLEVVASDVLAGVAGAADVIIANPPYLVDDGVRAYRDGGGPWGLALADRIARESVDRLRKGGQFLLYTGTPVLGGRPLVCDQLDPTLAAAGGQWTWELLDPDVFSEELSRPAYAEVERIAVYGLVYNAR